MSHFQLKLLLKSPSSLPLETGRQAQGAGWRTGRASGTGSRGPAKRLYLLRVEMHSSHLFWDNCRASGCKHKRPSGRGPAGARSRHARLASRRLRRAELGKDTECEFRSAAFGPGSLALAHPALSNPDRAAEDAELRRWLCAGAPRRPALFASRPGVRALTAQLVSDASGELLGHLTPGSRCKERQARGRRDRKRRADRRTC